MLIRDACQRRIGKAHSIAGLLLLLTQLILTQHTAFANLSVKPKDSDVVIRHSASFSCSSVSHRTIQWLYYDWKSPSTGTLIYANGRFTQPYQGRFHLDNASSDSTSNLVITSVQREDAGEYECRDGAEGGGSGRATLVVLDSIPVCQSNASSNELIGVNSCDVPSTDVQLSCSVSYHGQRPPRLHWAEVDHSGHRHRPVVSVAQREGPHGSGGVAVNNLTLNGRSIRNGTVYGCRSTNAQLSPTENECSVGPFKVIGSESGSSFALVYTVVGVAVFCLLLVAIFSFAGGIFLQSRKPLRLFVSPDEEERRRGELSEIRISPQSRDDSLSVWMEMAQSERKEKEALEKEIEQKINEVEHLEMGKCHLENRFYSSDITKYADKSIAVETLEIRDSKTNPITGMTILTKELFVTQQNLSQIAVYNAATLKFKRTVKPISNFDPLDLASCTRNQCLYVCVTTNEGHNKADILRFEKDGSLLKRWSVGSCCRGGASLSICRRSSNIVVCLTEENRIQEFSCDGKLMQSVQLHPSASIRQPCHALKTTDRHFVICHGGNGEDVTHQVCAIGTDGVLLRSYGEKKGSDRQQMNRPVYLTEDADGNVLVADMRNGRVLLLNSTLDFQRELITATSGKSTGGLRFPHRICLDEDQNRLFIGDSDAKKINDCRVLVYCIRSG